jgi:hypothetical protein
MSTLSTPLIVVLVLFTIVVIGMGVYYIMFYRETSDEVDYAEQPVVKHSSKASHMYQPVHKGTRSGTTRVFMTNKGLRTYTIEESTGLPLPNL